MARLTFKGWRGKWQQKELSFGYICIGLAKWYMDVNKITTVEEFNKKNDLSQVKVMKLLFFTVANSKELLDLFDNWHAVPYGHIESDVQQILRVQQSTFKGKKYCSTASGKVLIGEQRMILQ